MPRPSHDPHLHIYRQWSALQERRNDGVLHRHHPLVGMPALGTQSPLLHQMPSEQTGDAAENQTDRVPALMALKGVQVGEK